MDSLLIDPISRNPVQKTSAHLQSRQNSSAQRRVNLARPLTHKPLLLRRKVVLPLTRLVLLEFPARVRHHKFKVVLGQPEVEELRDLGHVSSVVTAHVFVAQDERVLPVLVEAVPSGWKERGTRGDGRHVTGAWSGS